MSLSCPDEEGTEESSTQKETHPGFMAAKLVLAQYLICHWFINAEVAPLIPWFTFALSRAWCELTYGLIDFLGSLSQQSLLRAVCRAGILRWNTRTGILDSSL